MASRDGTAELASDLLAALDKDGERALDELDWARRFSELGNEMDAGRSFEEVYGLALGDVCGLEGSLDRIDDEHVLGNAVVSECRYLTHWATGSDPDGYKWLGIALRRLAEIADRSEG